MNPKEAEDLIRTVLAECPGDACITSSFQVDCMVLVHMVTQQRPAIPVLFLDTGYHFAETNAFRDRIAAEWNLNLVNLTPRQSVAEQESRFGILWQTGPERCCAMRKVEPLFAGLEGFEVWFTALRREQSPTRANLKAVDEFRLPTGKTLTKVSPLADWTTRDVWSYSKRHGIPVLPLYDRGFTSVGCEPCTTVPTDPENPRSGRWAGRKLECGIHISGQ